MYKTVYNNYKLQKISHSIIFPLGVLYYDMRNISFNHDSHINNKYIAHNAREFQT